MLKTFSDSQRTHSSSSCLLAVSFTIKQKTKKTGTCRHKGPFKISKGKDIVAKSYLSFKNVNNLFDEFTF